MVLEVRLFGGLSAAVDGEPVELPADARARELLARLALAPGRHPRSLLAGRLRPDVPEASARKTLRNALYELRRALGPAGAVAVEVTGEHVGLSDAVHVDVRQFRRSVASGDLEAAAAAGEGELLAGFDGDWAITARQEHTAELTRVHAALAARAEQAGDLAGAADWARRRVAVEPLAEAAHRDLIRLLAAGGDSPAALAAARVTGERLRSELGIALSAETRALVEDVRRGRVARPAPKAATVAPALPAALAATVRPKGREPALGRLLAAWRETLAGAPAVALVAGEPGIGKTTIAGELARRVHESGAAVLLGRCDEQALVPFQPWIEALDGLLDALPPDEADHWLTAHDGALARMLPTRSPGQPAADDPRDRYLAFQLVHALFADLAVRRPVLLVLDDIHWADPDSLSLLRHLVRALSGERLLLVLCARSTELEAIASQTLADVHRAGPLVRIDLAGLDEDAVAAVLVSRTGSANPDAVRRLRGRSGGNPFFLDELLRERLDIHRDAAGPPAGVRDVIARRLALLGEPTRRTLDVAAICGLEFDLRTVAGAAGRPLADVLEALDSATDAALVGATDRPGRYRFAHALIGETITSGLPSSQRARLHLGVADVLADRHAAGGAGAGEVVRHLRGAAPLVEPARLAGWELEAAREATLAMAHADAATHYEAALQVPGGILEGARGEALLDLGRAHDRAGRRAAARAAFVRAGELARVGGDARLLAGAALGYGGTALVIAAADPTAVDLLERSLVSTPADDHATTARLLARLAVELYYDDRPRADELSAHAVEHARRTNEPASVAAALNARRVVLWAPHHIDERLLAANDMLAAAEAAADRELALQARNWQVVDLIELGRIDDAAHAIDAYEILADAVALPHFRWYVPLWRGTLAQLAGRWAESETHSQQALAIGTEADDPNAPLLVGVQRANRQYWQLGEIDRDRLVTNAAATPAAATGWLVYVALIDAVRGDTNDARRLVADLTRDACRAIPMDVNWHAACVLAEAAALVGDRRAGADLYALLEPHAALFPVVARAAAGLGSAEYYLGRLASLLGRHAEAVIRLRRAVDDNQRTGAAARAADALLYLGDALAHTGEINAARDMIHDAANRAETLDMHALATDAQRRLAALAT